MHQLLTATNLGTAGTNCTVAHYGDARHKQAHITLTDVAVTVGNSASLGTGVLIYTFPAGAIRVKGYYRSIALSGITATTDAPVCGLGTVIASGAVAVLSGTATFQDIAVGAALTDSNGTATVAQGVCTASPFSLAIATGAAHTVHLNLALAWSANADASGLLNGRVIIDYDWLAP